MPVVKIKVMQWKLKVNILLLLRHYSETIEINDEKEKNTNLVYSSKLKTEGILFEIDRRKILKWLRLNNIITDAQMPDIDNDVNIKEWFADNVHGEAVTTFNGVEEGDIITKAVFSLLHSMAHAFINIAGEISGLSVESLSEIIFNNIM